MRGHLGSALFPYTTLFRSARKGVCLQRGRLSDPKLHPDFRDDAFRTARRPMASRQYIGSRSEEHTSELQSQSNIVCRPLLEKKNANLAARPALQVLTISRL